MNYIDDTIIIDFPVSKSLWDAMLQCEIHDREKIYGQYFNDVVFLVDHLAKVAYIEGEISADQWNLIKRRYRL